MVGLSLVLVTMVGCERRPAPVVEHVPESSEHEVVVGETRIHYFDFHPSAPGTPVLFLHGYSGSGYEAFFFQDELPNTRIIAPDLPGLGRSEKPDVRYDLSYYLHFVRNLIRTLGLEEVVLVGHSLGGKIAAVYTALHGASGLPEQSAGAPALGRVSALVLIAPYGLDGEAGDIIEALSNTGDLVDVSFNLHNQTLVDVAVRLNVFHDHRLIPEDLIDYIAEATFYSENGVKALASITRNAIARDPIDWLLPEIAVPTLVVWGESDRVLPFTHATTFRDLIPGSRLVAVPECGHMPHVERQAETANAIEAFMAEVAPDQPD